MQLDCKALLGGGGQAERPSFTVAVKAVNRFSVNRELFCVRASVWACEGVDADEWENEGVKHAVSTGGEKKALGCRW